MRKIVLSIFMVTVLTLSLLQTVASAEEESHELSRKQLATKITPTTLAEVVGRKSDQKDDGMMMNGSASGGHGSSKKQDALDKINKIVMMYQAIVSTLFMFVDAVFKAKSFGITLITTAMAIVKFIMDLKNYKNNEQQKKETMGLGSLVWGEDRLGMAYGTPYRPAYYTHYPTYMHKYKVPS